MFFRTYSPQGDGNVEYQESDSCCKDQSYSFSEPIPRKGTETIGCSEGLKVVSSFFRTYSPQGDGNLFHQEHIQLVREHVFQNLFPARGRKPSLLLCLPLERGSVFQNLFPARGRKLHKMEVYKGFIQSMFFRTYSPQGDGN